MDLDSSNPRKKDLSQYAATLNEKAWSITHMYEVSLDSTTTFGLLIYNACRQLDRISTYATHLKSMCNILHMIYTCPLHVYPCVNK